jgi:hypothetical protein
MKEQAVTVDLDVCVIFEAFFQTPEIGFKLFSTEEYATYLFIHSYAIIS